MLYLRNSVTAIHVFASCLIDCAIHWTQQVLYD